jgi:hypothetical protein
LIGRLLGYKSIKNLKQGKKPMSINTATGINISLEEVKEGGVRCVKGYCLEVPVGQDKEDVAGRTDQFEGVSYKLSIEQAETLHKQLGESLAFIKPLIATGKIKEI